MTNFDKLDAVVGRVKVAAILPTTPVLYYGEGNVLETDEWKGGEFIFLSVDNRMYIQTATSGYTATWKRIVTQFATSTTSTSTSTSSSTSSSSTTSSSTTTAA